MLRGDPGESFDHFFALDVLAREHRVSSRGAIGEEAVERGAEADLTRHRGYNQLKMYTELYRMLGLIRSAGNRASFVFTPLAHQLCDVAEDKLEDWDPLSPLENRQRGLIEECLLAICVPNPSTEQRGVAHLRPFRQLLRITQRLDGVVTREELLISLYGMEDDRPPEAIDEAVAHVEQVRGDRGKLETAVEAARGKLARSTIENYTRFPLGVIRSPITGWATDGRDLSLYPPRAVVTNRLTEKGSRFADRAERMHDIREVDVEGYSVDERAALANVAFYAALERAGYDVSQYEREREQFRGIAQGLLEHLEVQDVGEILYSAVQQASNEVLERAEALFEEV